MHICLLFIPKKHYWLLFPPIESKKTFPTQKAKRFYRDFFCLMTVGVQNTEAETTEVEIAGVENANIENADFGTFC